MPERRGSALHLQGRFSYLCHKRTVPCELSIIFRFCHIFTPFFKVQSILNIIIYYDIIYLLKQIKNRRFV